MRCAGAWPQVMVFFSSCASVKYHGELLNYIDIPVKDIHGKQKQQRRTTTFMDFCKVGAGLYRPLQLYAWLCLEARRFSIAYSEAPSRPCCAADEISSRASWRHALAALPAQAVKQTGLCINSTRQYGLHSVPSWVTWQVGTCNCCVALSRWDRADGATCSGPLHRLV